MNTRYAYTAAERFMRYAAIDTQSDPKSETHPSSEKQKNLANLLVEELKEMGLEDAYLDQYGYVYATVPGNADKNIPVICFCAHMDTAPDCSGTNVKPILHKNYKGQNIILPDDPSQIITVENYPYLKNHIGHDIITASGLTLLGADDKAGVAIIMDMVNYMVRNNFLHGEIRILFTPDEEVGRGTDKLKLDKLSAAYAYTLDGGEAGTLEDETFSANALIMHIKGVIAHPGNAKGKMVNAIKIAGEIIASLPVNELSPESTEGRQGFVHPVRIEGVAEHAEIEFIIRDFDTDKLNDYEQMLMDTAKKVLHTYAKAEIWFETKEQYRNMKEILNLHNHVVAYAEEAYKRCGLPVKKEPIRGGTDGSRLSFMGLPCPNLFTGMQAIHSRHEWIGIKDMQQSVDMLISLLKVWEENSS